MKRCVICGRKETGSGLCDACSKSYSVLTRTDETIAGMLKWCARRAIRIYKKSK